MLRSNLRDCCRWDWLLCNLKAEPKTSGFAFTSRSCSNEPPLASTWMVASTAAMPTSPPLLEFNQYFNESSHDEIIVNLPYKIKQLRFLFVWHKRKSWQWNGYKKVMGWRIAKRAVKYLVRLMELRPKTGFLDFEAMLGAWSRGILLKFLPVLILPRKLPRVRFPGHF